MKEGLKFMLMALLEWILDCNIVPDLRLLMIRMTCAGEHRFGKQEQFKIRLLNNTRQIG